MTTGIESVLSSRDRIEDLVLCGLTGWFSVLRGTKWKDSVLMGTIDTCQFFRT